MAQNGWQRQEDGTLATADGRGVIADNGPGFGSAKGSGRWAVEIDGEWIANVDYLADAKARAMQWLNYAAWGA